MLLTSSVPLIDADMVLRSRAIGLNVELKLTIQLHMIYLILISCYGHRSTTGYIIGSCVDTCVDYPLYSEELIREFIARIDNAVNIHEILYMPILVL